MMPRPNPTEILRLLSADRVERYRTDPSSGRVRTDKETLRAYEEKMDEGARYWLFIGGVEVLLRNTIDGALKDMYGEWSSSDDFRSILDPKEVERLDEAWIDAEKRRDRRVQDTPKARHHLINKEVTHGHVVSEFNFSFWRYISGKGYDNALWSKGLSKAFINLEDDAKHDLRWAIQNVNNERNNVAHHERIKNVARLKKSGLLIGAHISPDAEQWLDGLV